MTLLAENGESKITRNWTFQEKACRFYANIQGICLPFSTMCDLK